MNASKMTPLAALISVALLAGCGDHRDTEKTVPGSTTTAGSIAGAGSTMSSSSDKTGASRAPVAGGSGSTTSGSGSSGATRELALADKNFVSTAAVGGMFEVEASKLAAGKASDPAVKAFARMLIDHHTKLNNELKALVGSRGNAALPMQLPSDKQAELKKMQEASGAAFDRQYVQKIGLEDHQADIRAFEKASKDSKDPDLKAWAAKTLPTLREHLAHAKTLPGGGSGAATTGRVPDVSSAVNSGPASSAMGSETIRQVQRSLKDKGHDAGPVDGVMGAQTQSALRSFQQAQGIEANGRLDQRTLAALGGAAGGMGGGAPGAMSDSSGSRATSPNNGTMSTPSGTTSR